MAQQILNLDELSALEHRFSNVLPEGELMRRLDEALEKLPAEFRQTFRMHRLEGMTHKEIAAALQVSPQTVNYRIGQTVRLLREELREYWPLIALVLGSRLS